MRTNERDVLVGVFDNRSQAQQAVNELKRAGFLDEQIGVISRNDGTTGSAKSDSDETYAEEGAVTGLAAGAGIGALWGLGILAGVIPGIGPAIAGGTLGVLLSSAAAGAAAAGIAGALVGLGIPEEEAKHYESEFRAGRTIVTVKGSGRAAEARTILQRLGAHDIQSSGTASSTHTGMAATGMGTSQHTTAAAESMPSRPAAAAGESIQLHEERVQVKKQPVETGEVTLRKEVHTEHKHIEVPVTKEEIVIERRPASGQPAASGISGSDTIRVPVREEQVVVEKQVVATEEVAIGKRKTQHTEGVDTTIRKEEVRIDKTGDVDLNR